MSALIIRMPDEKRERLKALAKSRNISVNKLVEELATVMLAEFDLETRFRLRAVRGGGKQDRGLALLRKAAKPRSAGPRAKRRKVP